MNQPKINIPKEQIDHTLERLSWLGLTVLLGLVVFYYWQLPDKIPIHFNLKGEPGRYGSKNVLWVLVGAAFLVYGLLVLVNRYPHLGNYMVKITDENAFEQYQLIQRLNRILNAIITLSFAYICFAVIQTALGNFNGLGIGFVLLFIGAFFGSIIYYAIRSNKLK